MVLWASRLMFRKFFKVYTWLKLASSQSNRSKFSLLAEAIALRLGGRKVDIAEYFELGLFLHTTSFSGCQSSWVGWRASSQLDRLANASPWRSGVNDKLVMSKVLSGSHGFPIAQTLCLYSDGGRTLKGVHSVVNVADVESFLRETDVFPLILKPIHGTFGKGVIEISARDEQGQLLDGTGKPLIGEEFAALFDNRNFGGVLVQKKVFNHREIASRVGNTLSTIRMIIVVDTCGRPDVAAAFWKVALEKNSTDNFARGAHGNLLADVDLNSGEVGRVCGGLWPTHQSKQNHPETQAQLSGFVLPHWDLAKATVMRAALEFPGLRLQGWDVGITDEGPLLLEVNTEISLEYVQLLTGRPFFSDTVHESFSDLLR